MKKIALLFCLYSGYIFGVGGTQKTLKINPYVKKIENILDNVKNGKRKINEQESPFLTLESLKKELIPTLKVRSTSEPSDQEVVQKAQEALVLLTTKNTELTKFIQSKLASKIMSDSELSHGVTANIYTGLAGGALFLLGNCLPETVNAWVRRTCKITGGFLGLYGFYTAKQYREHGKKKQELDDLIQQEALLALAQIQLKDLDKSLSTQEEQSIPVVEVQSVQEEEKVEKDVQDIVLESLGEIPQDIQQDVQKNQEGMDSSVLVNAATTLKVLENHFGSDNKN